MIKECISWKIDKSIEFIWQLLNVCCEKIGFVPVVKGKISVALLMMKINLSLVVLLLNLMQVLAIIKETISYDAKGQVIR